jgi:hypothetical protein
MILALYEGDAADFQDAFLKIAVVGTGSDLRGLSRGLRRLLARWREGREGEAPRLHTHFTSIMLDLLALSRATDVWPAPEVLRYIRSVISTDGLIQRFAPGFDVGGRFHAACRQLVIEEGLPGLSTVALAADFGAAALRRFTTASLTVPGAVEETAREARPLGRPVLQLLLLATGCALAALHHPEPRWGLNLFSAELLAAGAAALALLALLARYAGAAPEREV